MRGARRKAQRTVLIVGEGACEVAFLGHLKSLYCQRGCGVAVTIHNAHGKGPEHVVNTTMRQHGAYDLRVALLDRDVPWTDAVEKKARREKIILIGNEPCLEGMLLEILGRRPSETIKWSVRCKVQLHELLSGNPTEKESYLGLFPREQLDKMRVGMPELKRLLAIMESGQDGSGRGKARTR